MRAIIFILFISTVVFSQQLDNHSVTARFTPLQATGGFISSFQLPWDAISLQAGWSMQDLNTNAAYFGSGDPTGWLDLGATVHSPEIKNGMHWAGYLFFSLGLRDAYGWRVGIEPKAQYKTRDDNLFNAVLHIDFGSTDPNILAFLDWQWSWEHVFFGPRAGYSLYESLPIIGGTIGAQW